MVGLSSCSGWSFPNSSAFNTITHTPSKTRSVLEHTTFLSEEELMSHFICLAGIWKTFFSTFCQREEPPGGWGALKPTQVGISALTRCFGPESASVQLVWIHFYTFLFIFNWSAFPPPPFLLAFITIRSDIEKNSFQQTNPWTQNVSFFSHLILQICEFKS